MSLLDKTCEQMWNFVPDSIVYLTGPTGAGKSEFILHLLSNQYSLLGGDPLNPPSSITYCYGFHSSIISRISLLYPEIRLHQGLDKDMLSSPETYFSAKKNLTESLHNLLIIDDLGPECAESIAFTRLLTQGSHHLNITIIIVTHSLFFEGKQRKLQMQQASYFVLFKSPRSTDSVARMSSQIATVSPQLVKYAFKTICQLEYIPLIIDVHKATNSDLTLLSHILPEQYPITVYSD